MKRIYKMLVLLVLCMTCSACLSLDLRQAESAARQRLYGEAVLPLMSHLQAQEEIPAEVVAKYHQIFTEGRNYYANLWPQVVDYPTKRDIRAKEEEYILLRSYFMLPEQARTLVDVSYSKEAFLAKKKALQKCYENYGNQFSSKSYQGRLQKFLTYQRGLALATSPSLSRKFQAADSDLERRVSVQVRGFYDHPEFGMKLRDSISNMLRQEPYMEVVSSNGDLRMFVEMSREKYVRQPGTFESFEKEGKANEKSLTYREIQYEQTDRLFYDLRISFYDKNGKEIFKEVIPCEGKYERKWKSYFVRPQYRDFVKEDELEPKRKTREELFAESIPQHTISKIQARLYELRELPFSKNI